MPSGAKEEREGWQVLNPDPKRSFSKGKSYEDGNMLGFQHIQHEPSMRSPKPVS